MKKTVLFAILVLSLAACAPKGPSVMARYVPERADDFVFENDLIAGRFYGEALEGNPTSPGLDIWVKLPGKLVADDWYAHAVEDPGYYHHNHGGKDCYKVAVSLGGGASVPVVDGKLAYPATNYRSYEILSSTPKQVVFALHYPAWTVDSLVVSLDKEVTVTAGSRFCRVKDTYSFNTDSLTIAAGIRRHKVAEEQIWPDRFAIWEEASDQSVEPEDGMIGVALVMEGGEIGKLGKHMVSCRRICSGESVEYAIASCWSKAGVRDAAEWFRLVESFK